MSAQLTKLLHDRSHRIKDDWVRRLRATPPRSALADPAILVHRMDETLGQLIVILDRTKTEGATLGKYSLERKLRKVCQCGLNPLLDYFITGDAALSAIFSDLNPADFTALATAWHGLAHREVESLCGACCRKQANCALISVSPVSVRRRRVHLGPICGGRFTGDLAKNPVKL